MMNSYEEKQAARKLRLEERAAAAKAESDRVYSKARDMASAIPFGQPILIGHHSEQRDTNYRNRIHTTYGKAFALQDKAEHYERAAAGVGTAGISSDDPEAIQKLRAELAAVEQAQARMKEANKVIRGNATPEAQRAGLIAVGFSEAEAGELVKGDFCGRVGFASYALSNNNANARRIRLRIEQLEKLRQRESVEIQGSGYTYREDTDENRVMFRFPAKPAKEVRELLSGHAFRWSPSRDAWVRQLNNAGLWAAKRVREVLDAAPAAE